MVFNGIISVRVFASEITKVRRAQSQRGCGEGVSCCKTVMNSCSWKTNQAGFYVIKPFLLGRGGFI